MLTTLAIPNVSTLSRYSVGIDDWLTRINTTLDSYGNSNHPPHNLVKENETNFRLELALSGYSRDEIKVSTEYNKLIVEATKKEETTSDEYLYRGIASRAFTKSFCLSDDVQVSDVRYVNGLLVIKLTRVVPEHQKKRTYLIT